MIKTSRQLKDKIKNLTHGDSLKSQTLLRTYMMERFLERLAVSQYNSHFGTNGDTELFKKSRNINGFRACRIANNLY